MDLTFNINNFNLTYENIDQLLVRKVSAPFKIENAWYVKVLIQLRRTGDYEVQTVESRNIDIPLELSQLFDKFLTEQGTTADIQIINQFIGYINPAIVISEETPIYNEAVEGEEVPPAQEVL